MKLLRRILFNLSYVSIILSVANSIVCFQLEKDLRTVLKILDNNVDIQSVINRELARAVGRKIDD